MKAKVKRKKAESGRMRQVASGSGQKAERAGAGGGKGLDRETRERAQSVIREASHGDATPSEMATR